ncbi:MAG: hypothetical protein IPI03_00820 [Rubrivivax sp.]|nr:hypothetical protein [Rubrivivax sp.]MBK7260496.1 hypothetical protein [Rubrivivax sp.]MBK8526171.1 hypothetical protein [Rubrivivax sp.]
MSADRTVLVLHEPDGAPDDLAAQVEALRALGLQVDVRACVEPYDQILDATLAADTIVFWR